MEYFSSLFFQEVQHLSALQTALRFLPAVASGAALNIWTGFYAHRFRADYLVATTTMVSAAAPLLMALINPSESYWYSAFWAMLLGPLSADGKCIPERLPSPSIPFQSQYLPTALAKLPQKGAFLLTSCRLSNSTIHRRRPGRDLRLPGQNASARRRRLPDRSAVRHFARLGHHGECFLVGHGTE